MAAARVRTSIRRKANVARYRFLIAHYLSGCFAARVPAGVEGLAAELDCNRSTLSRTVLRHLGKTATTLIRDGQMKQAIRLLRATDESLAEIAILSAFRDYATFYRAFRSKFGVSPSEYRERHKRSAT